MNYTGKNHTFVVCAYKESPYLEACICSLKKTDLSGEHDPLSTSTPNVHISELAEKHQGFPFI